MGSLFIVFVKVIIWVIAPLVHCWAGGRHFIHLKELALLVVIKFWGVGGVFVLLVFFSLIFIYSLKFQYNYNIYDFTCYYYIMIIISVQDNNVIHKSFFFHTSF